MPRAVVSLTDPKCAAAKPKAKDYKLSDGQGLFLLVKANGTKVWRFKFVRPGGREGLATFGSYPAVPLKLARVRREEARALLARGIDPVDHARQERAAAHAAVANTFQAIAVEWHASMAGKWSEDHAARVLREMEADLFPTLGKRGIAELKTKDLLTTVKAVERRGAIELAGRLRQRLVGIMRIAVQQELIDSNPALDLQGSTATRKVRHRAALPLDRLPDLLTHMEADTGRPLTRYAVKLSLLVFIRSSELRFARWKEIDLKRRMWTIPGEREAIEGVKHSNRGAKMRTPHLVPLSPQAIAVLKRVHDLSGRFDLVFPGDHYHWKPMSENTINKALRRMGFDTSTEVCGHGFRTMACSALIESGLWSRDAVERQMSHQERDGVRAAYIHRAQHIEERRLMMDWWADYLDANRQQHVTPYDFANRGEDAANVVGIKRA